MRTRDTSNLQDLAPEYWFYAGPTDPGRLVLGSPRWHGSVSRMTDNPTKGFRRLSGNGSIINTPMTRKVSMLSKSPKDYKQYSRPDTNGKTYVTEKWVRDAPSVIGEFQLSGPNQLERLVAARCSELETQAITEAYAAVGRADVESLISLLELPETVEFIRKPILKGVAFVKRLKGWQAGVNRRQASYERRLAKWGSLPAHIQKRRPRPEAPTIRPFKVGKFEATDISSSWLAFRYGLMPIIYQIQDIHKALTKPKQLAPRLTARGFAGGTVSKSYEASNVVGQAITRSHTVRIDASIAARAGVLYVPREETLSSQWGLELHRVPAALYEGIPLSFVTDWFHSAATYYDALTSRMRLKQELTAWVKVTVDFTVTESNFMKSTGYVKIEGGHNGFVSGESGTIKYRTVATINQAAPQIRVKMNLKRVVDGLSLIHQFASRR